MSLKATNVAYTFSVFASPVYVFDGKLQSNFMTALHYTGMF